MITIAEALQTFLAQERQRTPSSADETGFVLDNLVGFLEGYGYQYVGAGLPDDEHGHDEARGEIDEPEQDFVATHAPDMIPASLSEFLYYWNIRKFMGDADDARATGEVMARLMDWLGEQGLADRAEALDAAAMARVASDVLPRAKRLSDLLYDLADASWAFPDAEPEEEIDDFLAIVRIEPGRLWLEQGVGPIVVPEEASRLAEVGWEINLVATKRSGTWSIEEIGNVYPRTVGGPDDDLDDEA